MREQTVAVCRFVADLLTLTRPSWTRPAALHRRLTHAQVLTTAPAAARFFWG